MPSTNLEASLIRELVMLLAPEISRSKLTAVLARLAQDLGPIITTIVLQNLIDSLRDLYRMDHPP